MGVLGLLQHEYRSADEAEFARTEEADGVGADNDDVVDQVIFSCVLNRQFLESVKLSNACYCSNRAVHGTFGHDAPGVLESTAHGQMGGRNGWCDSNSGHTWRYRMVP